MRLPYFILKYFAVYLLYLMIYLYDTLQILISDSNVFWLNNVYLN